MLFICVSCRKIIGCSETLVIKTYCDYCDNYNICLNETPLGKPVGRKVFFVKYSNSCEGHNRKPIGFKRRSK